MPIIYDEEWGGSRVVLNPFLTIDESVIVLMGKSLIDYPLEIYDESGNHEATFALEDYLQTFYDDGDEHWAEKGLEYYELLLDAVEKGELVLHNNKFRAVKLIEWANKKKIQVNAQEILFEKIQQASLRFLYQFREAAIITTLGDMGIKLPVDLPDRDPGGGGIKAEVWEVLCKNRRLFSKRKDFNNTWQDLRDKHLILGNH